MVELSTGKKFADFVYFCPECGSASIQADGSGVITSVDQKWSCGSCKWEGLESELIATPILHEFSSRDEIIKSMMGDLKIVMAKSFMPVFGQFLLKWGFLDKPISVAQVRRYAVAISASVMRTVIEERQRQANTVEERDVRSPRG